MMSISIILYVSIYIALLSAWTFSEALSTTALIQCRSEGLAQGPYVVARVAFEPATLWMQGSEQR